MAEELRPIHVLLIDDDPNFAAIIKHLLSKGTLANYQLTHVERLASGLESLRTATFDAVVIDLHPLGVSRLEAVATLRRTLPDLCVIGTLPTPDKEMALRCLRDGAQDCLVKSAIGPALLEHSLLYAIERHSRLLQQERIAVEKALQQATPHGASVALPHDTTSVGDAILSQLDAIFVVLSPEQKFHFISRKCEEISGFTGTELKGRAFISAFAATKGVDAVQAAFGQLENGEKQVRFTSDLLTKQGHPRRLEWSFRRLNKASGTIHSLIGAGLDVTELTDAKQRLEQLELEGERLRRASEALRAAGSSPAACRRAHERRGLARSQRIAPLQPGSLPDPSSFFEVLCIDLSQSGIAYLVPAYPDYTELIVALGTAADTCYMRAEIRNIQPAQHEGSAMYRVGCKFLQRTKLEVQRSRPV